MKTNRPVKLVCTKTEDYLLGTCRPVQTANASLAARKDGTSFAIDYEGCRVFVFRHGAGSSP